MKIQLLSCLLLLLLAGCQPAQNDVTNSTPDRPNIILVMTDDQGYGDLSVHGNPILKTPQLDSLHAESVRFSNFHVATTCSPTRAGLMTGQHCNRTGTWHTIMGRSLLSAEYPTIADYLKEAGYQTGMFGKWHLGDNYPYRPMDRGFEETFHHGGGGVGQAPDYWDNDYFDDTYFHNGKPKKVEGFCTDVWFDTAIQYMESVQNAPFFCYMALNAAHSPHYAPQAYIDPYLANEAVPNPGFYGQIANIDANMGKLRKWLETSGLIENTILIFTTDNGTAAGVNFDKDGKVLKGFNAGMRGRKGSEYEGGHRVPLLLRFPESMEIATNTYDQLTTYTDIVPTLLDLLSIPATTKFDGQSIKPLLTGGEQLSLNDRIVVVDTQRDELLEKWKRSSVMQGTWRLVNREELYDVATDPFQSNNIFTKHPEKVAELSAAYETWWADHQEDAARLNYIAIGAPQDNPTTLYAHDWHSEQMPPWHQRHVRTALEGNGYWWIRVAEAGNYRFRLYRWSPYMAKAATAALPEGEALPGAKPYPAGVALNLAKARIKVQDQEMESEELREERYFEFTMPLTAGTTQLQTWMAEAGEATRGAYYVEVEKLP
ncbi:MAG: arylsulfatase [Bacteroidota bacterium]